jgi:FHA domain-containing protein
LIQPYSSTTDNIKICSLCQKENPAALTACENCGASLVALLPAPTTVAIPDRPIKFAPPEQVIKLARMYPGSLILVVIGQEQPIILKGSAQVTLGRLNPGETAPTIDLTPYNADLLGVSRQHARIKRSEDRYTIEDVGSTNGTWVNEIRLKPHQFHEIENGALIRLGQLGLYAYFETVAINEETITLKNAQKLTPQYLASHVTPYLNALAGVQGVGNEFLERPAADVSLISMNADESKGISIKIEGAKEAIQLAGRKLPAWKEKHQAQISRFREISKVSTNGTAESQNGSETASLRYELTEAEIQLALDYLAGLAPEQPEDKRKPHLIKLVPYLHTLIASPLQVSID